MRCYNHEEKEAISVCHACGKGLCRECSTEVEGVMSCKNTCEARVKDVKDLVDKNISTMKSGRFNDNIEIYRLNKKSFMNGIVMWGVVFLFLCFEVVRSMNGKEFNLFAFWLLVLCCFMLFNSINGFMKWRKLELKK